MMKHILRSANLLLLLLGVTSSELLAQTINISAIIRPRFEVQYGYRVPPDSLSKVQPVISQRTRLNAAYNSERFSAFVSIQDARVWGDEVLAADIASIGLHEAWAQYNFSKKVGFRAGRMEFAYDNKRLLTNGEWPQQGRAYDAAVLKLAPFEGWKVDVAGSYNQQAIAILNDYYALNNYKTLDFLWVNKSKIDTVRQLKYNASAMLLADGVQKPDSTGINMRYTYGLNTSFDHTKWGLNFEVYGQSGKTRRVNQSGNITPDSFDVVKAYFFSVNPWLEVARNFQVGLAVDYMSGSNALDSAKGDVTHMFNPTYGANDRFYGKIDWFFNMPADTRNAGLIDNYLTLRYLYKKWNFALDYHYFLLQNKVEDVENPGQALDKSLGSELDIWAIRDITKDINVNTGVALFFPTRSMEYVKTTTFSQVGGPTVTGVYFWLQLTFKPVFFSK